MLWFLQSHNTALWMVSIVAWWFWEMLLCCPYMYIDIACIMNKCTDLTDSSIHVFSQDPIPTFVTMKNGHTHFENTPVKRLTCS